MATRKPRGKDKQTRILWNESEWYEVMQYAVPYRDRTQESLKSAIEVGQRHTLPKARHRTLPSLSGGSLAMARDYEHRFRSGWRPEGMEAAPPAEPGAAVLPASPVGRPSAERDAALEATFTNANNRTYWTKREWAEMSLAVKTKIDAGDSRGLGRIFFETQPEVLPLDRCRNLIGFRALPPLQKQYDQGQRDAWTLPADVRARLTGRGAEYAEHMAKTAEGLALPAAVPAEPMSEPTAAADTPAPLIAPTGHTDADPLAARIAIILADAAGRISLATREHMAAQLDSTLDRFAIAMAQHLRGHVEDLTAELGGPVSEPSPPLAMPPRTPEPAPSEPEPQAPPRVKVDVVGIDEKRYAQVRDAAERLGLDARFIHPDDRSAWKPRATVLMATRTVPHRLLEQATSSPHTNVLFANGGTASIVGMLESLAEHRGALQ